MRMLISIRGPAGPLLIVPNAGIYGATEAGEVDGGGCILPRKNRS